MRKRRQRVRFSLFAFQDIITGLCGVLILLVLLMLVDFVTAPERSDAATDPINEPDDSNEAMRKEIRRLEDELASAREATRTTIISVKDAAAPEVAAKLLADMSEKEKELAALVSQIADLKTRVAKAKDADARDKRKVREMEETRRILEGKIAALKNKKGVTLIPERGSFKSPVYIICGKGGAEILCPLKKNAKRLWVNGDNLRDGVTEALLDLDHTTHTVILLIRPSGVEMMDELSSLAKSLGFSYGRDPLEEDVEVSIGEAGGAK